MKPAILLSLVTAAALAAGAASAAPAFHPAATAAEKALDQILTLDGKTPQKVDPVAAATGRRPRVTPPPGAAYLKYLTAPVATAILVEEAQQVKTNCGGVYKRGEECGTGSDSIICAQDTPASYLFQTDATGPDTATVEAAWPPDGGSPMSISGSYRLELVGGVWKIDGISCAEGGGDYNWKPR